MIGIAESTEIRNYSGKGGTVSCGGKNGEKKERDHVGLLVANTVGSPVIADQRDPLPYRRAGQPPRRIHRAGGEPEGEIGAGAGFLRKWTRF